MVPLDDLEPCAEWRRAQAVDAIPVADMREAWIDHLGRIRTPHPDDATDMRGWRRILIADHPEAK